MAFDSPNKLDAPALEEQCVHKVYNAIADSFSDSRYAPWPGVMKFLKARPPGAWGADIGCGNGKYLIAVEKLKNSSGKIDILPMLASDSSVKLIELVRQKGFDGITANLLSLPYRPGILDFFICIAVLHHLATPERRVQGIRAMAELLKVGGEGLIQIWAKDQKWTGTAATYVEKHDKSDTPQPASTTDATLLPCGLSLPVQKPRTPFVSSDVLLPWNGKIKKEGVAVDGAPVVRYYHVFEQGEIEALIAQVPCLQLIGCLYEQGNWSACVRKINVE